MTRPSMPTQAFMSMATQERLARRLAIAVAVLATLGLVGVGYATERPLPLADTNSSMDSLTNPNTAQAVVAAEADHTQSQGSNRRTP